MKKQLFTTGILLGSCLFSTAASAMTFTSIISFGDSLVDNGNYFQASRNLNIPGLPRVDPPYFEGRFSNGPVFVEILASELGLSPEDNRNFAFGGATTGFEHVSSIPDFPGLLSQIDTFRNEVAVVDPNALYVIAAGANDYDESTIVNSDPTEAFAQVEGVVDNLSSAVTNLAEAGAQNILVVDVPDLGIIPGSINRFSQSGLDLLTELTDLHNFTLGERVQILEEELNVNLIQLDINTIFRTAIENPNEFNFTNVTDACFSEFGVCNNPEEFLFWDSFHPTAESHELLADFALKRINQKYNSYSIPEPLSTISLVVILGMIYLYKKEKYR